MFKTMVLVCSMSMADTCIKFEDTTGLRSTKEQCKERAEEMLGGISNMPLPIPPPYAAGYRCAIGEET
jgi:hypothetical protein